MQFNSWDPVRVTDTESEYHGRAGTIRKDEGEGNVLVALDETDDFEAQQVVFAETQLVCIR